jgi:hypothetical protein
MLWRSCLSGRLSFRKLVIVFPWNLIFKCVGAILVKLELGLSASSSWQHVPSHSGLCLRPHRTVGSFPLCWMVTTHSGTCHVFLFLCGCWTLRAYSVGALAGNRTLFIWLVSSVSRYLSMLYQLSLNYLERQSRNRVSGTTGRGRKSEKIT